MLTHALGRITLVAAGITTARNVAGEPGEADPCFTPLAAHAPQRGQRQAPRDRDHARHRQRGTRERRVRDAASTAAARPPPRTARSRRRRAARRRTVPAACRRSACTARTGTPPRRRLPCDGRRGSRQRRDSGDRSGATHASCTACIAGMVGGFPSPGRTARRRTSSRARRGRQVEIEQVGEHAAARPRRARFGDHRAPAVDGDPWCAASRRRGAAQSTSHAATTASGADAVAAVGGGDRRVGGGRRYAGGQGEQHAGRPVRRDTRAGPEPVADGAGEQRLAAASSSRSGRWRRSHARDVSCQRCCPDRDKRRRRTRRACARDRSASDAPSASSRKPRPERRHAGDRKSRSSSPASVRTAVDGWARRGQRTPRNSNAPAGHGRSPRRASAGRCAVRREHGKSFGPGHARRSSRRPAVLCADRRARPRRAAGTSAC